MSCGNNLDSIHERTLAVMNNNLPDIPHDVTFVVGEKEVKLSCHKIFLAIVSPVFEKMFSPLHSTHDTPTTGMEIISGSSIKEYNSIVIPDVDPEGLKNVIKYAYSREMNVDLHDAIVTMQASHKYDIPQLTQHCSQLLHSNLNVDNFVTIYQTSAFLNEVQLAEEAWDDIEDNWDALLDSEQFLEFSEENLIKFLNLDEIPNLTSEVEVFKAVLRWGNFQCELKGLNLTKENLRTVLKNPKSSIRFPVMEGDEFNEIVEPSGALSLEECIQLYKYSRASMEKRVSIRATLPYTFESRRQYGKCVFCSAAITDKLEIQPPGNLYDYITFSGNADATKLKSVGIVLPPNFPPGQGQSVSVGLNDSHQWTHTATKMISKPLEICYVEFENPVSLQSDVKYLFSVNIANGMIVGNPTAVVKYSTSLMKKSTFTCKIAKRQHLTITFIPHNHVIWGMQFVN